ncbi:MAG TPA: sensor histidine kinase [Bryobacteraceae bacterium]|jgi:signal transduction histidine kinase|nr:sensor histidine kinase [Bryobacteraceae bacterium]
MISPESRLEPQSRPKDALVALEDIDIFTELAARPSRPPNFEAENRALAILATELAENPRNILQKLVETAVVWCRADTAGISLLETQNGDELFRWVALAGLFVAERNQTMPRSASPCGVCIDDNAPKLMYLVDRLFPAAPRDPRFVEVLLVPFHHNAKPIGTVWAVMHQFERKFDCEDVRLLTRLSAFASAGWEISQSHSALENLVAERTAELSASNAVLHREIEERKRVDAERRRLMQRVAITQEQERRRIGRDLHDHVAQQLAFLQIELSRLRQHMPDDPDEVAARLDRLTLQVDKSSKEVRSLSHRLHPSILEDLGLEPALRDIVAEYDFSYGDFSFIGDRLSRPVPLPVASALYRIAQEALRNSAKHAPGAATTVTLLETRDELRLTIHDDGPGFDPDAPRFQTGLGLVSMRERAELVGIHLVLDSKPGAGTEIRAKFMWPEQ